MSYQGEAVPPRDDYLDAQEQRNRANGCGCFLMTLFAVTLVLVVASRHGGDTGGIMSEREYDNGCKGDGCLGGCSNCREFEVTLLDTGKTLHWNERKCEETFGKAEFDEILKGYLPNIVAVPL